MNNDYNNNQQNNGYPEQQYQQNGGYPNQQYQPYQQPQQPYQQYGQPYYQPYVQPGDSIATSCMVCGILSLFFAGLIFGIIAVCLAAKAKREGYVGGKVTCGTVTGIIGIVVGALGFLIIFAAVASAF